MIQHGEINKGRVGRMEQDRVVDLWLQPSSSRHQDDGRAVHAPLPVAQALHELSKHTRVR